jgi:hypothetical protein
VKILERSEVGVRVAAGGRWLLIALKWRTCAHLAWKAAATGCYVCCKRLYMLTVRLMGGGVGLPDDLRLRIGPCSRLCPPCLPCLTCLQSPATTMPPYYCPTYPYLSVWPAGWRSDSPVPRHFGATPANRFTHSRSQCSASSVQCKLTVTVQCKLHAP